MCIHSVPALKIGAVHTIETRKSNPVPHESTVTATPNNSAYALRIEAVRSDMMINFYGPTCHHIPENIALHNFSVMMAIHMALHTIA
jgi:hypothetical protein